MSKSKKNIVVAIDGPAASGKGTLARKLSEYLRLPHLDTGLTYRAVAHAILQQNGSLEDQNLAEEIAGQIDLSALDKKVLSDHKIGEAASKIAVMPGVRHKLMLAQRAFATASHGAVLDGRDIATVVCPEADYKFYVTARADVRARRRHQELVERSEPCDQPPDFQTILEDIKKRDKRDMLRDNSPLKLADDAHLIDTSEMDIETAFKTVLAVVDPQDG